MYKTIVVLMLYITLLAGAKRPEYKALIACKDQIVLELTQFVNSEDLEKTFFAEGLFSSSVHSTLQSHNTMGIKSELLVNALTRRVKIFPHFFYGMVHILKSQEALSSTLFENLRRQYEGKHFTCIVHSVSMLCNVTGRLFYTQFLEILNSFFATDINQNTIIRIKIMLIEIA